MFVLAACGSDTRESTGAGAPPSTAVQSADASETTGGVASSGEAAEFPDVLAAVATREDSGSWRFDVTLSSPYDSPDRYADAWRVIGPDGTEYGIRILTHDHANEQPFTRSQTGIEIPDDVEMVTVEGRDLRNGWGGGTLSVTLPRG